jgi:hypothetical protein
MCVGPNHPWRDGCENQKLFGTRLFVFNKLISPFKTPCHLEGALFAPEKPVLRSAEGTPRMGKDSMSD